MITHKFTEHFGELSKIDVIYAQPENDAVVLLIVTVGFLNGDPETQKDLLDKMEGYLGHIQSSQFKNEYPQNNVYIDIVFQEIPAELILQLLYKCIPWCQECGATLRFSYNGEYFSITENTI